MCLESRALNNYVYIEGIYGRIYDNGLEPSRFTAVITLEPVIVKHTFHHIIGGKKESFLHTRKN